MRASRFNRDLPARKKIHRRTFSASRPGRTACQPLTPARKFFRRLALCVPGTAAAARLLRELRQLAQRASVNTAKRRRWSGPSPD